MSARAPGRARCRSPGGERRRRSQAQLYVPNQDDATVSVIDPATRRLLRTVDLRRYGVGDNAKPHHIQVEPDGSAWYVTLIGAGKVLKLDRERPGARQRRHGGAGPDRAAPVRRT